MQIIGQRKFEMSEQMRFASLSGDYNPIHTDEILSRKLTFGEPVVHGVHLLLWVLNELVKSYDIPSAAIQHIQTNFHKGILLGRTVALGIEISDNHFISKVFDEDDLMATIKVRFGQFVHYKNTLPPITSVELKSEWCKTGNVPLMFDSLLFGRMFPYLSTSLPPFQLASILSTTRLVGMECPGLNSLYSSLDIYYAESAAGTPELNYEASEVDSLSGMTIKVNGPGFSGELRTYIRPAPVSQPSVVDIKSLIDPMEFQEHRVLIIGGTRGIGEVTAKILSCGGADVTITYNKGVNDADRVQKEIQSAGFKCSVVPYDCKSPCRLDCPDKFTHLYYFATPRIMTKRNGIFSESLFQKYCKYYVTGFFDTVTDMKIKNVFFPSTISLSTDNYELPEYRAAKAAGEEICRQLRCLKYKVYVCRFSRILTDQTNWFLSIPTEPIEKVVVNYIRDFMRH